MMRCNTIRHDMMKYVEKTSDSEEMEEMQYNLMQYDDKRGEAKEMEVYAVQRDEM